MRTIFEEDGKFGILCDGGLEYETTFDTYDEAKMIAAAHDAGAETYEDAITWLVEGKLERLKCECGGTTCRPEGQAREATEG